mgnify:FL=1
MMDLFRHLRIHTQTRKGKPMYTFGKTSMSNLKGVHQDLVSIMVEAISTSKVDFGISEGLRTKERQRELVKEGKSQTMNSRHLTGHAVDIFIYKDKKAVWEFSEYIDVAHLIKSIGSDKGITIEWGGDWETFKDAPHFQLSWNEYVEESETPEEEGESIGERPSDTEVPSEDS